jgi:hypothetical protein
MFCFPFLFFGGTEGVGSRFHVLHSRTRFRRYRGRWVSFSCFMRLNSFSAVPTTSAPVFFFCATGHIFDGVEGVGSFFHVLCSWTRFRRFCGCWVPFSCFVSPYSFSLVARASGPDFMVCAPRHVFGVAEGVGSRFHVLRSRTRFRRYRGLRVPFSCFALPKSFSAIPRVSGPVFMC